MTDQNKQIRKKRKSNNWVHPDAPIVVYCTTHSNHTKTNKKCLEKEVKNWHMVNYN